VKQVNRGRRYPCALCLDLRSFDAIIYAAGVMTTLKKLHRDGALGGRSKKSLLGAAFCRGLGCAVSHPRKKWGFCRVTTLDPRYLARSTATKAEPGTFKTAGIWNGYRICSRRMLIAALGLAGRKSCLYMAGRNIRRCLRLASQGNYGAGGCWIVAAGYIDLRRGAGGLYHAVKNPP